VPITFARPVVVVGAPRLVLTYSGTVPAGGRPTRVFAQLVDKATGLVLGNQVTPVPVALDGSTHVVSVPLEIVAYTATPSSDVELQLVATTVSYAQPRLGGTVHFASIRLALPTAASLTPVTTDGGRRRRPRPAERVDPGPAGPPRSDGVGPSVRQTARKSRMAALTSPGGSCWRHGCPLDRHHAGTAHQSVGHPLGLVHRDRGVGGAVDHERGHGDLLQAVFDALALDQRLGGIAQFLRRALHPHGGPHGGQFGMARISSALTSACSCVGPTSSQASIMSW